MAQSFGKNTEVSGHCASFGNQCVHSMNIAWRLAAERGFI
jgi:hypothetical protein